MAQEDAEQALEDLKKFVVPRITRIQRKLQIIWSKLIQVLDHFWKKITKAIQAVAKYAVQLGAKIGKSAVQKLLSLPKTLGKILQFLKKYVKFAMSFAKKILALLKSKLDPVRLLKQLKALIAQFAKHVRLIWARIKELLQIFNPVSAIIRTIMSMQAVLRMMFSWIKDLLDAGRLFETCMKAVREAVKLFKSEMGELTKVVKRVNTLKLAA